jgi:hypothetical protein
MNPESYLAKRSLTNKFNKLVELESRRWQFISLFYIVFDIRD